MNKNFNELLLKTAFACMASDGDIDKREIRLIKKLHNENKIFGDIDITKELDRLVLELNKNSFQFLKNYFDELGIVNLSKEQQLKLIEVAIDIIKADDKIEYSEIKFFKVIRSKLRIDNDSILKNHPDFEVYLEEDIITDSYLSKLQSEYFKTHILKEFKLISQMDDSALDSLIDKNDDKK